MTFPHEKGTHHSIKRCSSKKKKRSIPRFFIVLSLIPVALSKEQCLVFWELRTIPIIFGVDVVLECMAIGQGKDCFGSRIFKWSGGPENDLISFDNRLLYPTKYRLIYTNTYSLVIKNVTTKDLNVPYACHCGFHNFEDVLKNVSYTYHSLEIEGELLWNANIKLFANKSKINEDGKKYYGKGIWSRRLLNSTMEFKKISDEERFIEKEESNGYSLTITTLQPGDSNMRYRFEYSLSVFTDDLIVVKNTHSEGKQTDVHVVIGSVIAVVTGVLLCSLLIYKKWRSNTAKQNDDEIKEKVKEPFVGSTDIMKMPEEKTSMI
ncbi:unnamed protein product [Mytilus coruscus]|uniref:Uncharacterized protein n=1 Tax=Mytilus coruscus TaxID=42192 RepID=A0A6J8EM34_MYTCO|nr:unnamed protein product [Mytilus coruscus]